MVNFFSTKSMANDDFSEPPRRADPKTPIFIFFCRFLGLGHLRGPGVILGSASLDPLGSKKDDPGPDCAPPPPFWLGGWTTWGGQKGGGYVVALFTGEYSTSGGGGGGLPSRWAGVEGGGRWWRGGGYSCLPGILAPVHQLLGAADAQTAHPATSRTAPTHQRRGSANAETTPAGAPAAAADRTQRPDATCEGESGWLSRAP